MANTTSPVFSGLRSLGGWMLLLFLGECTLGSSGRWLVIGPFSIRILLFIACFLLTLPSVLQNLKRSICNLPVMLTLMLGGWYLISALVGIRSGNAAGFIKADITALLTLALMPAFLIIMTDREMLMRAVKVIFAGSTLLSLAVTGIHFALSSSDPAMISTINTFLNSHSLGGLALLSTGMHRIYMKSQMFTPVSLLIGVWLISRSAGRRKAVYYGCEALQLFNLILSFTRGMWLGFVLSAFLLLGLYFRYYRKFFAIAGVTLGLVFVLILLSSLFYRGPFVPVEIVNRFSPSLITAHRPDDPNISENPDQNGDGILSENEQDALVDQNNMIAVILRAETMAAVKEKVHASPLLGHGLGTNLDGMREDGKIEYMYWDILMKCGIPGLLLFLLVFFLCPLRRFSADLRAGFIKHPCSMDSDMFLWHTLLAAYLGVAVNSYFNPFLSNPMGIMIMLVTLSASYTLTDRSADL